MTTSDRARLIAIVLPYAVAIRDFVHSGVIAEVARIPRASITIYTQNPDLPELDALRAQGVTVRALIEQPSGRSELLLKKIYPFMFADKLYYVGQTIARRPLLRMLAGAMVTARKLLGERRALGIYSWLLRRVSHRAAADQIAGRPDVVVSTRSLVNSADYGLLLEAARRGLEQVTAAGSWDNFTTKGYFPFPVARTIVWNRKMADELRSLFAVPEPGIVIGGYPRLTRLQLADPSLTPEDYLRQLGVTGFSRFVLYSASYSELTRPSGGGIPVEYQLIREVVAAIEPHLPAGVAILVRLHPFSLAEDEGYFDDLPRVHLFVPGRRDRYVERVMSEADEFHLSAQLRLAECVVSMASTMTIDALALNTPIINVAFEPAALPDMPGAQGITRFYNFNHFRDLVDIIRPPMARSVDDVVAFVVRCLAGDRATNIRDDAFEHMYVPANSSDYPAVVRRTIEDVLDHD